MEKKAIIGKDVEIAKLILTNNDLVAIPTETVYGLAGNALNIDAITKIFKAKDRPYFDPLIIHIHNINQLDIYCKDIPVAAYQLAKTFWPGPLTLLLNKKELVPDLVTSGMDRVAVRIPNHPVTLKLLKELKFPLAAPSANPFGYISPTTPYHVLDQLGSKIPYILDGGACKVGVESTIIGFDDNTPTIYRLGGLSLEAITAVVGEVIYNPKTENNPKAPGMLKSHYAPRKPFFLTENMEESFSEYKGKKIAILSFNKDYHSINPFWQVILSKDSNTDQAAQKLFAAMRELDTTDADMILAEKLPDTGLGRAINDRLQKASFK